MKRAITVIVMTSVSCNMHCTYCYVSASKQNNQRLPIENLETLIENSSQGFDAVHFCWHGGEPLLAGRMFYETVLEIQNKYRNSGAIFSNVIQTNGTLLNNDWLRFFKKNNFGVGVSVDLPLDIFSIHRDTSGIQIKNLLVTIKEMKSLGLPVNILCVISKLNVGRGNEIFQLLSELEVDTFSILPLKRVPLSQCPEEPTNNELSELYKTLFDLWITKETTISRIEPIASMIEYLAGDSPQLCSFSSSCLKRMITITQDGNVTPCTSLVANEYILGNIFTQPLNKILSNDAVRKFKKSRTLGMQEGCNFCEYISICRSGCRADAFWSTGSYQGKYPYCESRKETFSYIQKQMNKLSNLI